MGYAQTLQQIQRHFIKCAAVIAAIFFVGSTCNAQNKPAGEKPQAVFPLDLNKYPGLLEEFSRLAEKLQHNIQFPAARGESRLLPLLPESTVFYAALPNYGDVTNQALKVFRQERQESVELRDWWDHGEPATAGPKVEDFLEKFSQLHEYLGEEIVMSVVWEGKEPNLLIVAQVRKPGLKKFLQQMVEQFSGKTKPSLRVLDLEELATAKEKTPGEGLMVLIRPDYVVGAVDLATLRSFNARLNGGSREFVPTPFGQRISQEYQGGVTVLAAADLHKILKQASPGANQNAALLHSGFADVKYLVWAHKNVAGQPVSQMELSFNAPRHGAASWLAKPGPMGSLDFVSDKTMMAGTVVLTNPAGIFEDVKELATLSNSNAFAMLPGFEKALNLSLKDDLLSLLGGELTVELDSLTPTQPVWKAILRVNDAGHLQQTLSTLMTAAHFELENGDVGGVAYQTVQIPSQKGVMEIGYAFVDGYLVVGTSRNAVAEAVASHRSGGSLGKSKKFLTSLPPGYPPEASALLYEDPIAMAALRFQQLVPGFAESISQASKEAKPAVVCVYGEEMAIREVSRSSALDAGAVLIVAAIAIPNLLRSRIAANEASAVGSVRTVNTAQYTYSGTYPQRGFAPNLATLGSDPRKPTAYSPEHAGLLDQSLANESCIADAWCTKSGYRFRVTAICKQRTCQEYVVVATPADSNTGTRSFCSTSDGVIRYKAGSPLTSPLSVSECKAWPALQ
jgi:type II secretory pathway pseudopilin PulG